MHEQTPVKVSPGTKQTGEAPDQPDWRWVERCVWTDRMLTALEIGVKGGKWFSLIDKVYQPDNLAQAFAKVKANNGVAGVDHVSIAMFEENLEVNLRLIGEQLQSGAYRPQAIRRVLIPKPGSSEKRPLGIPTVRDRVVQGAVRNVIEPIFEWEFAEHSYGFRPRRGAKDALREVDCLLKAGYTQVVDADLRRYFDTIPHELLMGKASEKIADGSVNTKQGSFEFLGYQFSPSGKWPRAKSMQRFMDTIREKTKRTKGHSLKAIIADVNRTLRGWFEYFKHAHRWVFGTLDKWIRGRLRSILRKRLKLRGRGRGADHQRWPNVYFAKHGLFFLERACAAACQSASAVNH